MSVLDGLMLALGIIGAVIALKLYARYWRWAMHETHMRMGITSCKCGRSR